MKLQTVALGETRDPIDAIVAGEPKRYHIDANAPFAFPPAADFPDGGLFSIRVDADGELELRKSADGDGFILDPGRHRIVFVGAETHVLFSTTGIDIAVLPNLVVGEAQE